MRWLLDTNVISEGIRSRPNANVLIWLSRSVQSDLAISSVTLAELRDGASTARDEARRKLFTDWLDTEIIIRFAEQTLPLTTAVLVDWLQLSRSLRIAGKARDAADLLIASTARIHRLTVVTRNVRDFADTGVVVYDPWQDQTHHMDQP